MHPREPARLSLAQLPTPLVEVPRLSPGLLVKRDDLTGLELSGNKIRKLEYVLADALAKGATSLVTHGGFQSNHCRASAAAGARLGLPVRMFLRSADANPSLDGNLFLDHFFGATVTLETPEAYANERQRLIDDAMNAERAAGRVPYFFPVGASVPIGCWGYIRCVRELMMQVEPGTPVDLFVTVGSSGTMAGSVLGKALFGLDHWRVVGVPICDSVEFFQKDIRQLIDATIAQFDLQLTAEQTPIELIDGYIGDGYAIPYPAAVETIRDAARLAGLVCDPTYTGKGLHATLDTLRRGGVRPGATPIFLHTGGAFGLTCARSIEQIFPSARTEM